MDNWTGHYLVERYEIGPLLGYGKSGIVHEVFDHQSNKWVVVKIFHAHLFDDQNCLRELSEHFKRLQAFNHPSIVQVLDFGLIKEGKKSNTIFGIYENYQGGNLGAYMQRLKAIGEDAPLTDIVTVVGQVADALASGSQAEIFHSNIHPKNILLQFDKYEKGIVRPIVRAALTDLDLAFLFAQPLAAEPYNPPPGQAYLLDQPGTDIYALGVILYQLLTGVPANEAASIIENNHGNFGQSLKDIKTIQPSMVAEMSLILNRSLSIDTATRYQNVSELARDLRQIDMQPGNLVKPGLALFNREPSLESPEVFLTSNPPELKPWSEEADQIQIQHSFAGIHTISRRIITIGSHISNDILLPERNILPYHAQLEPVEGGWQVRALKEANNIFLNDISLLPHEPQRWQEGQILYIGHYQLNLSLFAQRIEPLRAVIHIKSEEVALGESQTLAEIELTNNKQETIELEITCSSQATGWIEVTPQKVALAGQETRLLTVAAAPDFSSSIVSGSYPYEVNIWQAGESEASVSYEGVVFVEPYDEFHTEIEAAGDENDFFARLTIHNLGNQTADYEVNVLRGEDLRIAALLEGADLAYHQSKAANLIRVNEQSKRPQKKSGHGIGRSFKPNFKKRFGKQLKNPLVQRVLSPLFRIAPVKQWIQTRNQVKYWTRIGQQGKALLGADGKSDRRQQLEQGNSSRQAPKSAVDNWGTATSFSAFSSEQEWPDPVDLPIHFHVVPGEKKEVYLITEPLKRRSWAARQKQEFPFSIAIRSANVTAQQNNGFVQVAPRWLIPGWLTQRRVRNTGLVGLLLILPILLLFTHQMIWGDLVDKDGLPNLQEVAFTRTDPRLADTDGDRLNDSGEIRFDSNPSKVDTDQDGLLDGEELQVYGTDPLDADSDNDGLTDSEEILIYQTDPNNPQSIMTGFLDSFVVGCQESVLNPNGQQVVICQTPTPSATLLITWPVALSPIMTPVPTVAFVPSTTPITQTLLLTSILGRDGFIINQADSSVLDDRSEFIVVGDGSGKSEQSKGFVTFDLSSLPANAVIQRVTLRLFLAEVEGNPFDTLGTFYADVLANTDTMPSTSVGFMNSSAVAKISLIPTFESEQHLEGNLEPDVVHMLLNSNSSVQFLLYFELTENQNRFSDLVYIYSAEHGEVEFHPQLVLVYRVP